MLSYESQMPAAAGTRRSEKPELWFGTANRPGGFCHAPPRRQWGTSPSHYMPLSPPLWIPAFAGMTIRRASVYPGSVYPGSESGMCFRTNDDTCRLDVSGLY